MVHTNDFRGVESDSSADNDSDRDNRYWWGTDDGGEGIITYVTKMLLTDHRSFVNFYRVLL